MGDLARHDVLDEVGLLLRQFLDQLMDVRIGQQLGDAGLDELGEMGGKHGRGIDHGVALDRRFLLEGGVDPGGRQPEGRLIGNGGPEAALGRRPDPSPMNCPGHTLPVPASISLILIT